MKYSKFVLALLAPVLIALSARASDWYADALNGSDANNGMSAATAWKTLTHALASLPGGSQTLHIAPGTYNAALGESYPLVMRPGLRFVGDQGSSSTILESAGATLLEFDSDSATTGYTFGPGDGASGLTLRNSSVGIEISTDWNPVSPSFQDLVVRGMQGNGISILTYGFGSHTAHPTFGHVSVLGCNRGFDVEASGSSGGSFGTSILGLSDGVVQDNAAEGIYLASGQGAAQANLVRCRVTGNQGNGIRCYAGNFMQVTLIASATLIAGNQASGVGGTGGSLSNGTYQLSDCTIANNSLSGFAPIAGSNVTQTTTIRNSILYGNLDDFVPGPGGSSNISYCDSGDGDLLGRPNCIAADPLFVYPPGGDYRLRFGSPCVESGDPGSTGALDLLGHARPIDGDLDTIGAVDMGALELETLHRSGTPSIGHPIGFEFWGAAGSTSGIFFSNQALTAPQSTPFGDFDLAPGSFVLLGSVPALPGPPYRMLRWLPNNPLLIGQTFSYQGLTTSSAAPQGQAYTNATSFVVLP